VGRRAVDALTKAGSGQAAAAGAEAPGPAEKLKALVLAAQGARNRGRLDDETDALEQIVALDQGDEKARAQARLDEIAQDPELTAKRAAQVREREARALLARGKMWLRTTPDAGRKILQELIDKYPDTPQADEARGLLEPAGK